MSKKCRYCYVLDNGEPTFYDLNKKDILQMYQVEDLLNTLLEENKQLKQKNEELEGHITRNTINKIGIDLDYNDDND